MNTYKILAKRYHRFMIYSIRIFIPSLIIFIISYMFKTQGIMMWITLIAGLLAIATGMEAVILFVLSKFMSWRADK